MFVYILNLSLLLTVAAQNGGFLAQRPAGMVPCTLQDPTFTTCFSTNVQQLFSGFKNGIPGELPGSDPVGAQQILIQPAPASNFNLNGTLNNVSVAGASTAIITNANLNQQQGTVTFDFLGPLMTLTGDYNAIGEVLSFPLQNSGKATIVAENVSLNISFTFRQRFENNFVFFDIDQFRLTLVGVSNARITFDGLGSPELQDTINEVINQNWRSLYEPMYPTINNAFGEIMSNYVRLYWRYIPANYLVTDLPTSA